MNTKAVSRRAGLWLLSAVLFCLAFASVGAWGAWRTPRVVIDYRFDEARDFHEGLAAVKSGDVWGYIDNLGRTVLPFVYRVPEAGDFSEGLAFVGDRYIDVDGNPAFAEKVFQGGLPFSHGLAAVQSGGQWGFIDLTGKFVIVPTYEAAGSFSEGLAPVRRGGLWGYVDAAGRLKIPHQYLHAEPFSEGLAAVEVHGRFGYIDGAGRDIIKPRFDGAGTFHYSLAPVKSLSNYRGWGFINKQNKMILPYRYNAALPFSEGLAAVAADARWGFVNVRGEWVLPGQFDDARSLSEGLAAVRQEDKWGYIRP